MRKENNLESQYTKCNLCGKELMFSDGILKEEYICVEKQFGYFSRKDGEKHRFCLCEDCYDRIVQSFAIPVHVEEVTELV